MSPPRPASRTGLPDGPSGWQSAPPLVHQSRSHPARAPGDEHTYHRLPVVAGADPIVDQVPWELLHVRTAGLDVFSTHLAPAPGHGLHRVRQVVAIDDHIRRIRGDQDTITDPPGDPFARRARAGRVVAAELAFDDTLTGRVASDHAGPVVDVVWPQRPT